jgi:hypothetical protein
MIETGEKREYVLAEGSTATIGRSPNNTIPIRSGTYRASTP